ncbi:DUF1003 domain-containing protein [Phreatobacter sp.]|uniref:DUF1003 domain-containing protein n=1 Tax=Phreatobacter sp. TaxID=1966341 RepID=UPI003F701A98
MNPSQSRPASPDAPCALTGRAVPPGRRIRLASIRPGLADLIRAEHPDLSPGSVIDSAALAPFRARYVEALLKEERGELNTLERDVVASLSRQEVVTRDVDATFSARRSIGEKLADQVASFGGSWTFIVAFFVVLCAWMAVNVLRSTAAFDPYPFILLNLVLSCLAAVQAPIIMMSQGRQEAKDRQRSENDYRVNLKAELEIRHLHDKVDHLLTHQWERLAEIQAMQIELLQDLRGSRAPSA